MHARPRRAAASGCTAAAARVGGERDARGRRRDRGDLGRRGRPAASVALALAGDAPRPGTARIHVEFDAPFVCGQKGLFKTKEAGVALRVHPVRGHRRAPRLPVLRRAGLQDPVHRDARRPRGRCRPIANTPEVSRDPPDGRRRARALRADPAAAELPRRVRRRAARRRDGARRPAERASARGRCRCAASLRTGRGQGASPTRSRTPGEILVGARAATSASSTRTTSSTSSRCPDKGGRDGERGRGHVRRAPAPASTPKTAPVSQRRGYAEGHGARARAPVVRATS